MTAKPASSTKQLLRASSDDQAAMTFPLPDSGFGFHAQQAVEKLYKALIVSRTGNHPHKHDLKALRERVESLGFRLPLCGFNLERLSEYAGDARYDEPIPLAEEERLLLRTCVAELRAYVLTQTDAGDKLDATPDSQTPTDTNDKTGKQL